MQMENLENTRRLPSGEGFMDNKNFNDLIYAYLQAVSYREPSKKDRYVWKRDFIKKDVAKTLKINFRTFQRRFDYLVENGYVIIKDEIYELPKISEYNFYIPLDTLKYLIDTTNEDVIRMYVYLGQLKKCMGKESYFTKSKLLILMGYKTTAPDGVKASTNKRDWERINNILDMLENKLELIECKKVYEPYKNGTVEKIYYDLYTEIA